MNGVTGSHFSIIFLGIHGVLILLQGRPAGKDGWFVEVGFFFFFFLNTAYLEAKWWKTWKIH